LIGDPYQIPPTGSTPFYETLIRHYVENKPCDPSSPGPVPNQASCPPSPFSSHFSSSTEACGAEVFRSAVRVTLATQQRSQSGQHTANINALRCTDARIRPITFTLLNCYKFLCRADLDNDPLFRETAIAVATNACRHQIILTRLIADAIARRSVILSWRNPLTGFNAGRLSELELEHLYRTHPALTSFFLPGAPCFCLDNWNPGKGLFNGTSAVHHSLILDPREDLHVLEAAIREAKPGKFVMLTYPPKYINVRLPETPLSAADSLHPNDIIVPIPQWGGSRVEKLKAHEFPHLFPRIKTINYRQQPLLNLFFPNHTHVLVPTAADPSVSTLPTPSPITRSSHAPSAASSWTCTSGQVLSVALLPSFLPSSHLSPPVTGTRLSFEMFLVGLTRVRDIEHLRFMPLQPNHTLEHLTRQAPNPRMLAFLAGYDKNGQWNPAITKQELDKLQKERDDSRPSSKRKGKSVNNPNKRGRQSQTSHAPDKGKRKAPSREPPLPPRSFTVPGLDGIFKSFDTPEDGSCLFHAFKDYTKCTDSVQHMRTTLVTIIESIQDADIRVNHMLQFFPRKRLVPEQFTSRQFANLWNDYKKRMLDKEWCGMFEACELAKFYKKSIVLWEKKTPSTISIIERCILPGAQVILFLPDLICPPKNSFFSCKPAQDDIVHLLYVNNMHFESTNLPPNFLPLVPEAHGQPAAARLTMPG